MEMAQNDWHGPTREQFLFWVAMCALAELVGIAAGAAWWVSMDRLDPEPATHGAKIMALMLKSLSGAVEGIVLGALQYRALRRIYPGLSALRWIFYTAALAIAGWAIGSAIPIFGEFAPASEEPFDPPLGLLALASAGMGAMLGVLFGLVQRQALKSAAHKTRWWVYANATGWALALPLIYVAASIGDPAAPVGQFVATGLAAGLLAGVVLGLVTGLSFWKMEPKA